MMADKTGAGARRRRMQACKKSGVAKREGDVEAIAENGDSWEISAAIRASLRSGKLPDQSIFVGGPARAMKPAEARRSGGRESFRLEPRRDIRRGRAMVVIGFLVRWLKTP
jgi:hypothetical protein